MNVIDLKNIINEIGKCEITFDQETNDYLFNKKSSYVIPNTYYADLYNEFQDKFTIQLAKGNYSEELIKELLQYLKAIELRIISSRKNNTDKYIIDKSEESQVALSEMADSTQKRIDSIFQVQLRTKKKLFKRLSSLAGNVQYRIEGDFTVVSSNYDNPNESDGVSSIIIESDIIKQYLI